MTIMTDTHNNEHDKNVATLYRELDKVQNELTVSLAKVRRIKEAISCAFLNIAAKRDTPCDTPTKKTTQIEIIVRDIPPQQPSVADILRYLK